MDQKFGLRIKHAKNDWATVKAGSETVSGRYAIPLPALPWWAQNHTATHFFTEKYHTGMSLDQSQCTRNLLSAGFPLTHLELHIAPPQIP